MIEILKKCGLLFIWGILFTNYTYILVKLFTIPDGTCSAQLGN